MRSHICMNFDKPKSMEKRDVDVVVISDVHLGTYGCRAKELVAYLKSITPNILILNGDIIDGWQFSKRYFPASHMAVIKEVLNLITKGTRVFYITGNHDELLRRYSDFQLSHLTLTDKLVLEIDNKMTWIFHGDVFDNTTRGGAKVLAKLGSSGYGALILFNRFVNFVLKAFGREKLSISKSVMAGVNKMARIDAFEQIAAELAIEKKYDYVICGHIHQPQKRVIENEKGKVTYLNSGDWVEHLTALEYRQNEWSIFEYNEKDFPQSAIDTPAKVNVLTDEISFYINSLAI
jgi:UDP-2,3-diacylglucosamine pyrophosphatase LpxH